VALPTEYIELPYIYGDGSTWLNTGFCPTTSFPTYYYSIHCKLELTTLPEHSEYMGLLGLVQYTPTEEYTMTFLSLRRPSYNDNYVDFQVNGSGGQSGAFYTNEPIEIDWNDNGTVVFTHQGYTRTHGSSSPFRPSTQGGPPTTSATFGIFNVCSDTGTSGYPDSFKGKIYSVQIKRGEQFGGTKTIIREYIPALRISDGVIGFYETVVGEFLPATHGNAFKSIGSLAINYDSFINALVNRCKYLDDTSLSSTDKDKIISWLKSYDGPMNGSRLLNVGDAKRIIKRLGYRIATVSGVDKFALSSNMALSLLNAIPKYNLFSTLGDIFTSTLNEFNYNNPAIVLVEDIATFGGTLIGGGGGGAGGVSGDNGKQNVTTRGGSGWSGEESRFSYRLPDGTSGLITAAGGAGAGVNSYYHEGNAPYNRNGSNGTGGASQTISLSLPSRTVIAFVNGDGGSGGGASATKIDWGGTVAGGNATADAAGNANGGNSWSGEDYVHSGGGGAGGWNGIGTQDTPGKKYHSGPSRYRDADGEYGTNGVGGLGGYCDYTQTAQPTTVGAGGIGGISHVSDDHKCDACGGNRGNVGGFVADDATKNYLVLYEQEGASIELYY
jgi:hypothetical protein